MEFKPSFRLFLHDIFVSYIPVFCFIFLGRIFQGFIGLLLIGFGLYLVFKGSHIRKLAFLQSYVILKIDDNGIVLVKSKKSIFNACWEACSYVEVWEHTETLLYAIQRLLVINTDCGQSCTFSLTFLEHTQEHELLAELRNHGVTINSVTVDRRNVEIQTFLEKDKEANEPGKGGQTDGK